MSVSSSDHNAMKNVLETLNGISGIDPFALGAGQGGGMPMGNDMPLMGNYGGNDMYGGFNPGSYVDPTTGEPMIVEAGTEEFFSSGGGFGGGGFDGGYSSGYGDTPYMPPVTVSGESADAMADILRKFRSAGGTDVVNALTNGMNNVAHSLYDDSRSMPELRNAMRVSRTPNGTRMGNWEITALSEDAKRFDISHVHSGEVIAKDLYLYEAATAIVEHLNEGRMINHPDVQRVLALEVEYARNVNDAVHFKAACDKAIIRGDDFKLDVAKARFSEARNRALSAKKTLKEHLSRNR